MHREKKRGLLAIGAIAAVCVALFFLVGKPMVAFVSHPEMVRDWADGAGIWARFAFVGMMMLQIIIAVIPGEPLEICAGYIFGPLEGMLLCLAGALLGTTLVFLFTRRFGLRLARAFFPVEKLEKARFLQDHKRLHLLTFILFFIPGTPKDIMTYILGVTPMKLGTCVLLTTLARIPSVLTSTIGGDALGTSNFWIAALVFAITGLISLAGLWVYGRVSRKPQTTRKDTIAGPAVEG